MKLLVNILFGTNKLENLKTNKLNEYKKHKKLKKKIASKIQKKFKYKKYIKTINNTNNIINEKMLFSKGKNKLKNESSPIKSKDEIIIYNDSELNELNYKLALKYDKRNYWKYYFSLLKIKHALIFTFFSNNDYNSKIIKIDLFFFNFTLFWITNAIFFNDNTMHKIYKNKGEFDIVGQLSQITYSFLISFIFSLILEELALTERIIIEIKNRKSKIKFDARFNSFNKKIKIKILFYFILSTIFLLSFWYYLSMFCAIYYNAQIHLIKDTLLSFAISLIEPLFIYLIPGLFRIPALSKNSNRYILYKFSQILEIILI